LSKKVENSVLFQPLVNWPNRYQGLPPFHTVVNINLLYQVNLKIVQVVYL